MARVYLLFVLVMIPTLVSAQVFGGSVRVVDGDTMDVGGLRVRLHGIDAPELGQSCRTPDGVRWSCGRWVADEVRARIGARDATCETTDTDRYGRTVARCNVSGRDLGRMLVRDGLALAYRKYSMEYDSVEKAAAAQPASRTAPVDPTCAIKGNISRAGTRIYHMPGQTFYARTVISVGTGERWFCSETEARAAGWRRAKR